MSKPIAEIGKIVSNVEISPDTWDMAVESPKISQATKAGQFVHVRVGSEFDPFLRRPLSVGPCTQNTIRLIYTTRGRGTKLMTQMLPGSLLDMIGPLGKPFPVVADGSLPIFVGGGIGIVPLLLMDYQMPDYKDRKLLLGVRSINHLPVTVDEITSRKIEVASDDGSLGFHGNVVQLLSQKMDELDGRKVVIYGCGPGPMMKALKDFTREMNLRLYLSLEVAMGCALGACQSCAVPKADGSDYFLVCKDGPVFRAEDIDLSLEMLP